jgi:uncharacterized protein
MTTGVTASSAESSTFVRIHLVDALRGFSLLGIVIVHFMEQYLGNLPPPDLRSYAMHGVVDQVLEGLGLFFIRGKGFALFSFMFGLSFALQMRRKQGRDARHDPRWRFAWRLLILFGIGAVHSLLYSGDILMIYAVLGLPLLLFYEARDRWLWILAIVLIMGVPRVVTRYASPRPTTAQLQARLAALDQQAIRHYDVLTGGSPAEVFRQNAWGALGVRLEFQFGAFARAYQTFGYFLLGVWAGRRRLFEDVDAHAPLLRRALRWSLALTFLLPAVAGMAAFLVSRGAPVGGPESQASAMPDFTSWPMIVGLGAYDVWNGFMAAFYVTLFVRLFQRASWRRWLLHFVPVGRMALTAYLTQTAAGSLIFFGLGLGLLGKVGHSVTIPLALALFVMEIAASRWWLQRFRFGPIEWVWRSLTQLRVEPMAPESTSFSDAAPPAPSRSA